jgi:hypothetical protein
MLPVCDPRSNAASGHEVARFEIDQDIKHRPAIRPGRRRPRVPGSGVFAGSAPRTIE